MRVYFDNKGRIREFYPQPIFATSDKVDKLEAYADFDITGFEPSLTIKRADGVVLGPFPMLPALDEQGRTYHYYVFSKIDVGVAGQIEMTIWYNKYQYDDVLGEIVLVAEKPTAKLATYVYDAVTRPTPDNLAAIYRQIRQLQEQLEDLPPGDTHFIGEVPPDDVKRYRVWLDYSNDDIGVMFGGGGVVPMSEESTPTDELLLILDAAGKDEGLIIETDSEWLLVPEQGETLICPDETGEETLLIQNDEDELGEILNMLGDGVIPEGTTWPPREDLIPLDASGQSDDLIIETEPEQLILPNQEEELIFPHDAGEETLLIENDEDENLLF